MLRYHIGTKRTDFGAYCATMPAPSGHLVELEQQLAGRLADFDDIEASGLS